MDIVTKEYAKKHSLKHYFTGIPCKHLHVAPRYTLSGLCTACTKNNSVKFKATNPDRVKNLQATWYRNNTNKVKARSIEWNKLNKDRKKSNDKKHHRHRLNLTKEQIEQLMLKANYRCEICKEPETIQNVSTKETRKLAIDHCHVTNKIRGALCTRCNMALGLFKDSPDNLQTALEYLKKHK